MTKKEMQNAGWVGLWVFLIVGCVCVVVLFGRSTRANFSLGSDPAAQIRKLENDLRSVRLWVGELEQQLSKTQKELHERTKQTRLPF